MDHDEACGELPWFQPLSSLTQATMGMTERHAFTGGSLGTKWSDPDRRSSFFGTFSR
jgi:hypothetical protein